MCERAILLGRDQDFSALVAVSGATGPSLLNVRMSSVDPRVVADAVMTALREAADEIHAGAIVTLDDRGARVHRLPIR